MNSSQYYLGEYANRHDVNYGGFHEHRGYDGDR